MSGITGIYYLDGSPAVRARVESMLSAISHRGPDGEGIWCGGAVGLGQCMRWTTPEALQERLPLLSPEADFVLVADARLDNRKELIGELSLESAQARKISDGQLILQAYQTWGEACPGRLEGDFAFVVWDEQQRRLFCARDAAGVRPFYYYASPKLFAFASEVKSLLRLPEVQPGLNERKVADFLLWSFEDKTDTYYQNIFRLPPAATLVVDEVVHEPRQYWSLDPHFELHMQGEDEYVHAFKEQFDRSVCSRIRSSYPVGSALSGGLDSSAIACIARQKMALKNELPLKVFSAVFPAENGAGDSGLDERDYIDSVLAIGGFDPQYIRANQLSPMIDSQQLNEVLDEPFFSPTLFIFWGLFQSAHEQGVRIFLDGTDGDRTISFGTDRLADLGRSGRWVALWKESSALAGNQSRDVSAARVMWKYGLRPLVPESMVAFRRRLRGEPNDDAGSLGNLIRPEFARRVGYAQNNPLGGSDRPGRYKTAREKHWQELTSGLNALSLELFDKASAVFSIEMRFPFYDRRLMELCLALPAEMKLSRGWMRYILRAAMQGILPDEVRWRISKANLGAAFTRQFNKIDNTFLQHKVEESAKILDDFIDGRTLIETCERYRRRAFNPLIGSYSLYGAIILADWLRHAGYAG